MLLTTSESTTNPSRECSVLPATELGPMSASSASPSSTPVSYTHLDVYTRQSLSLKQDLHEAYKETFDFPDFQGAHGSLGFSALGNLGNFDGFAASAPTAWRRYCTLLAKQGKIVCRTSKAAPRKWLRRICPRREAQGGSMRGESATGVRPYIFLGFSLYETWKYLCLLYTSRCV